MTTSNNSTDIIFLTSLSLSTSIGVDCWDRKRPQPSQLSIYLHLSRDFLTRAGLSDNVKHSLHYGILCRDITKVATGSTEQWKDADELINAVTAETGLYTGTRVSREDLRAVRVVLEFPKLVLLADSVEMDVTSFAEEESERIKVVRVKNLVLNVIIGVNQPERVSKQRVILNLVLEGPQSVSPVDYGKLMNDMSQTMELTAFLTLEKFVLHAIQSIFKHESQGIETVTVRAQKPSALSFAHSSGVEMTRTLQEMSIARRW